jgi:hypothetical protein
VPSPVCWRKKLEGKLSSEALLALDRDLARPKLEIPTETIRQTLSNLGHHLSEATVRKHRNGQCSCVKDKDERV